MESCRWHEGSRLGEQGRLGLVGSPPCAGSRTWPNAGAGTRLVSMVLLSVPALRDSKCVRRDNKCGKGLWHETGLCAPRSPDTRGREPTFSGRHPILRSAIPAWVLRARGGRKGARRGWTFLSAEVPGAVRETPLGFSQGPRPQESQKVLEPTSPGGDVRTVSRCPGPASDRSRV